MQAHNELAAANPPAFKTSENIASWGHLAGFLAIIAGTVVLGFAAQHAGSGSGAASSGQLASHGSAIPIYLVAAFMDWALLYYCWVGVHRAGGNLETLSGGRWTTWKSVAVDMGIALPFWIVWEGAAFGVHWLLGTSNAKTVDSLLPQSLIEILVWIGVSITAGICEELAFRGYLQRQLDALGGAAVGVIGQGLVFGLAHAYQGWKNVVVICVLGILFGMLAAWRRNLRANIVVHTWADIWGGWVQKLVLR
ncbi:MAG: type II CAAX endopeptidase family protein [Terracidiphilus sp.]|jgi:membrane protease YdiL (CAAX protease family)